MEFRRLACLLPLLLIAAGPAAAASVRDVTTTPIVVGPGTPLPAAASVPAPVPVPAASSSVTITLGTTGDFERKSITYGCTGDAPALTVDYINAPPNYLALIPIDDTVLVFNTVLSGSGAKYAAGKYVWWNKGEESDLYDLTQGANAKPILACNQTSDTP